MKGFLSGGSTPPQKGIHFHAPEVVAKTGWTSFELADHILHTQLNEQYDFVSLLIGVNNQYRGLSLANFTDEFEYLLKKAIHFAGNKPERVIVLSIPDWGVTPLQQAKTVKPSAMPLMHLIRYARKPQKTGWHLY